MTQKLGTEPSKEQSSGSLGCVPEPGFKPVRCVAGSVYAGSADWASHPTHVTPVTGKQRVADPPGLGNLMLPVPGMLLAASPTCLPGQRQPGP